jgi:hypothetical protein
VEAGVCEKVGGIREALPPDPDVSSRHYNPSLRFEYGVGNGHGTRTISRPKALTMEISIHPAQWDQRSLPRRLKLFDSSKDETINPGLILLDPELEIVRPV